MPGELSFPVFAFVQIGVLWRACVHSTPLASGLINILSCATLHMLSASRILHTHWLQGTRVEHVINEPRLYVCLPV